MNATHLEAVKNLMVAAQQRLNVLEAQIIAQPGEPTVAQSVEHERLYAIVLGADEIIINLESILKFG